MASRFLYLRRLLTATNRSTLIGRASASSLPRRPVSAFNRTFGTVKTNLGAGYKCMAYDSKHWIVGICPPSDCPRDQIIDFYLKTLAKVVGSLEEARMKMYTVSTEDAFHFRAYIYEEQARKLHEMEGVDYVCPDVFEDDQFYEPYSLLVQSQWRPSSHHILDDIVCDFNPHGLTRSNNDPEIVKLRHRVRAKLKQSGLDDGAIQYILTNTGKDAPANTEVDAPAKKLGHCTAQPI